MQVQDCPIAGLKIIRTEVRADNRGFFIERFSQQQFHDAGLPYKFKQDNHSRSLPGVLRGLHYQHTPPQGKLVGAVRGRIWDVAVDIRPESSTYGKHFGIELSGENGILLWIPAGFAHGFCVLGDEPADVLFKLDAPHEAGNDGGIRFDNSDLNIAWPVTQPILSDRDRELPSWRDYCNHPAPWGDA